MSNASSNAKRLPASGEPPVAPHTSFQRLPWGPGAAVLVSFLSFALSQLLIGTVVSGGLAAFGWSQARITDWLNEVSVQAITAVLAEALFVGGIWWFLHRRKAAFKLLGFARKPVVKDVFIALLGFASWFLVVSVALMLFSTMFQIDLNQKQDEIGFQHVAGLREKIVTFITLVIVPPLAEETVFRGFLFSGLRKRFSFFWATLGTSLLFAGPHLLESSSGVLWTAGIDTFVLSMVLCYIREKTGALWAGILVHMLKNGLAFMYLYIFVSH